MSVSAVEGVVAAGNVPTWIIPAAAITEDPVEGTWTIPLSVLAEAGTAVKGDCHMDAGDLTIERTATTRERQRMCQKVMQSVKTGETIEITLSAVFNQNPAVGDTGNVNDVYDSVPEESEVYIAQAFGWDSGTEPTADTVIDLYKGEVQMRQKTQPTAPDEDVKFTATISGSAFFEDVALSAT